MGVSSQLQVRKEVSIIRKYHNHTLQLQSQGTRKTNKVKKPGLEVVNSK